MNAEIATQETVQNDQKRRFEGEITELDYKDAVQLVVNSLSLCPKLRVLDVYFGSNPLMTFLFRKNPVSYFGFETSTKLVVKCKDAYRHYIRRRKAYFSEFDGLHIPYVMNFFHRVISVYPEVDSKVLEDFLKEIYRVMVPGGILVFVWEIQNIKECLNLIEKVQLCSFGIEDLKVLQLNLDQQSREQHKSAFFVLTK